VRSRIAGNPLSRVVDAHVLLASELMTPDDLQQRGHPTKARPLLAE
jgi:hypothetical protein